ncbi:hypothetical protein FQR65_LT07087 [Abscondita terminalis]|nr:hypothetical protein FQR65_LT07087 [Abscondita terminalis]
MFLIRDPQHHVFEEKSKNSDPAIPINEEDVVSLNIDSMPSTSALSATSGHLTLPALGSNIRKKSTPITLHSVGVSRQSLHSKQGISTGREISTTSSG